jgi:hypothetical protein
MMRLLRENHDVCWLVHHSLVQTLDRLTWTPQHTHTHTHTHTFYHSLQTGVFSCPSEVEVAGIVISPDFATVPALQAGQALLEQPPLPLAATVSALLAEQALFEQPPLPPAATVPALQAGQALLEQPPLPPAATVPALQAGQARLEQPPLPSASTVPALQAGQALLELPPLPPAATVPPLQTGQALLAQPPLPPAATVPALHAGQALLELPPPPVAIEAVILAGQAPPHPVRPPRLFIALPSQADIAARTDLPQNTRRAVSLLLAALDAAHLKVVPESLRTPAAGIRGEFLSVSTVVALALAGGVPLPLSADGTICAGTAIALGILMKELFAGTGVDVKTFQIRRIDGVTGKGAVIGVVPLFVP